MSGEPELPAELTEANRAEFHLMLVALACGTAAHLRDVHGVEPAGDVRENARLHLIAHGLPEDYRARGVGRLFPSRRATDGGGIGVAAGDI